MSDHWTAEEYRRYRETGKMPDEKPVKLDVVKHTNCPIDSRIGSVIQGKPDLSSIEAYSVPKRRKYGNKITYIGWKKFDSVKEAEFYQELMLRVKAGELWYVMRQVPFDLAEQEKLQYFADFVAVKPDGTVEAVYDVKSEATRKDKEYIIKKKLMKELWGIEIKEV